MRQLSLAVVGLPYPNKKGPARRFEAQICVPGEPVAFAPEPQNKHDRWAVAVFSVRDIQIGYVNAEKSAWIGGMIREGREVAAIFQGITHNTAWVRIAFDGEVPTLPPQRDPPPSDGSDPATGFYPDEVWDD